ncbi:hypothetical protein, partial [Klebsiella oxytoca]|uniref:hypothetical protein n=1 Tax=Klebsiella oxytoca TaxID=571 RepID=UPI001CCA82F7
ISRRLNIVMHTHCKGIIIEGINIVKIMEREFHIKELNNTWQSQRLITRPGEPDRESENKNSATPFCRRV